KARPYGDAIRLSPDGALNYIGYPKIFADLFDVRTDLAWARAVFPVAHHRSPRYYAQPARLQAAQLHYHLLGQTIGQKLLAAVFANVFKRHYGKHYLSRRRRTDTCRSPRHHVGRRREQRCSNERNGQIAGTQPPRTQSGPRTAPRLIAHWLA